MVQKLAQNYTESEFSKVPGNKYLVDLKNEASYDIDQIVSEQGEFRKFVFGCQANNEMLPF